MTHLLTGGKNKVTMARCGYSSEDRSEFSGWQSKVTCKLCLWVKKLDIEED